MKKFICTLAILAVASVASANNLTLNFFQSADETDTTVGVWAVVSGDNDGLLNYDVSVSGITGIDGVASDGIGYEFVVLNNLNTAFQPTGFPVSNNLRGPSGADAFSAGASQFGAGSPLVGLGRMDVFVEGASAVPNNPDIDIPFAGPEDGIVDANGEVYTGPLGSRLGAIDFGTRLDLATLAGALGGGGTVFANGAAGTPIALDAPATINVLTPGDVIPEPSTAILAGLALVGFVARRK